METIPVNLVPCLPDNAPFTAEQRAYLNGFLAGLFSRQPGPGLGSGAPAPAPLASLLILFGSQTGTAERLAKRLAKAAGNRGFAPTVHDLAEYPAAQLASESRFLVVASTFGDGDPPDSAKSFWEFLRGSAAPQLSNCSFSVCALGDSNYPKFCGFGKDLDARLAALGAKRVHARADCDVDYEEAFAAWMNSVLGALAGSAVQPTANPGTAVELDSPTEVAESRSLAYDRNRPFAAALLANRKLTADGSAKEVRHFEFSLEGSGLSYAAGDALGVYPANCPELAEELITLLQFDADSVVPGRDGKPVSLRDALQTHYEITRIPLPLLQVMAEHSKDEKLKRVAAPDANGELTRFLWGREIFDLLLEYPKPQMSPAEFVRLLKKLPPRLYSISSSPKAHPGQVHLTINVLRYESFSRRRKGVCSTFLAERSAPAHPVPVFVHENENFRPPVNPDTPMIMVGPGTGVAPFRAFLHDRRAGAAKGRNWLFFGDQHKATDFLYVDELNSMHQDGLLTRFDTAFSRDQDEKLYVQHRMREHARELFEWLESGAHFYVCGDAQRMAKDVDAALHEVIQTAGNLTEDQSKAYVARLSREKRYQRDVY